MSEPSKPAQVDRLVIAYAFSPYADTSAIVAAKRVRARGERVDLVQNAMEDLRTVDPSLDSIAQGLIDQRAILPTLTRFGSWESVTQFCDAGLRVITDWQRAGRSYTSVYSRAHFIASHFLAARFVLGSGGGRVRWEAEFSDPLSRDALGEPRTQPVREGPLLEEFRAGLMTRGVEPPESTSVHVWGEYLALTLADELLFTNAAQRDYVLGLYDEDLASDAATRSVVSPHPEPPAALYETTPSAYELPEGVVNVGYFGNFYASQQPEAVFAACAALLPQDRTRVRLHVFTGDPAAVQRAVDAADATEVVQVHHRLPYLQFLHLAKQMDVLLAIDAASPVPGQRNPTLLSKWSDYHGSGTPVWGVVQHGSELDAQDLAYRSPLGHTTGALQVLTSLSRSGAC